MSVKMKSTLPKGDSNGLAHIVSDLIKDPKRYRIAIMVFDSKETNTDNDSGDVSPVLRIRRAEVVLPSDMSIAENLVRRAIADRTGGEALPFEMEEDLKLAFPSADED